VISPWLCHTQHFKSTFRTASAVQSTLSSSIMLLCFSCSSFPAPRASLQEGIPKDSILLTVHVTTEAPRFSHAAMFSHVPPLIGCCAGMDLRRNNPHAHMHHAQGRFLGHPLCEFLGCTMRQSTCDQAVELGQHCSLCLLSQSYSQSLHIALLLVPYFRGLTLPNAMLSQLLPLCFKKGVAH